jgi:hypothetical protein
VALQSLEVIHQSLTRPVQGGFAYGQESPLHGQAWRQVAAKAMGRVRGP